jgi:hypothetical protein
LPGFDADRNHVEDVGQSAPDRELAVAHPPPQPEVGEQKSAGSEPDNEDNHPAVEAVPKPRSHEETRSGEEYAAKQNDGEEGLRGHRRARSQELAAHPRDEGVRQQLDERLRYAVENRNEDPIGKRRFHRGARSHRRQPCEPGFHRIAHGPTQPGQDRANGDECGGGGYDCDSHASPTLPASRCGGS